MKPIFSAIALSAGLVCGPALATQPEAAPRSVKVDSDDSSKAVAEVDNAQHQAIAQKRRELGKPLEKMPREIDRRYEKK